MSETENKHTHTEGAEHKAATTENAGAGAPPAGEEGKKAKGKKPKAEKKAKAEKKPKAPKAPKAPKDGVINTILGAMQRDEGASAQEIVEILKKKFPERKGDGMLTTVRIQVSRLPARLNFALKKTQDETRGLVYKAPKSVRLDKPKKDAAPAEGEKK